MRNRKSVERSGVADPISERWGWQHLTYVEVCLGHICVAVVVVRGGDVLKYVLSGHCGSTSLPANRKMLSGASIVSISALPLFVTSTGSVTVTSTGWCASMVGELCRTTSSATCRTTAVEKKPVQQVLLFFPVLVSQRVSQGATGISFPNLSGLFLPCLTYPNLR